MSFDLDAAAAELAGEPFTFTHGGEEYELPPRMDAIALAWITKGRMFDGLERLLGAEQWARMQASPKVLDAGTVKILIDAYAQHSGQNMGESVASSRSSRSTVRPSKRTSSGTTKLR